MVTNNSPSVHPLLERLGRVPEHYELYPLPNGRTPEKEYGLRSVTVEDGKVMIFEFDFAVPYWGDIPWEDLDNSVQHCCKTCEWDFCRGKSAVYCPGTEVERSETCDAWELSPDAISFAVAEYYKALHEKHYGTTCISV